MENPNLAGPKRTLLIQGCGILGVFRQGDLMEDRQV